MPNPNLQNQVDLAAAGDGDALQCLIVHYDPILRGKLGRRLGRVLRRYLDIDDVLQAAYASAFQNLRQARFCNAPGFYRWLEQIAINTLRNAARDLRRKKRDIRRHVRADGDETLADVLWRIAGVDPTPSHHLARQEALAATLSCLARLSPDQQTVIRLRFIEERSVAEVAAEMNRSDQAIHALCYRALREMREHLGSITQFLSQL